jgi:glycosyltransferase involved in cell wall biosynthesis
MPSGSMNFTMRLVMITRSYLPQKGGIPRLLDSMIPLLKTHGMEIFVITRRYSGLKSFEIINDVPIYRPPNLGSRATSSILFSLMCMVIIRKLDPNLIHAHEVFSPATTAIAAKKAFGTPFIITAHRSGILGDVQVLMSDKFGNKRMALIRREADAFIVISKEIDEELEKMEVPPDKRFFIPNGVDTLRFLPLKDTDKHTLKTKFGYPEKAPIVIYTGRLAPEKCIDNLIDVWNEIHTEYPHALLLILGNGPEEMALKERAGNGIRFLGAVEDVTPYLQISDLFVLPSATEGLSVAMLEAMACGLPVLVTQVGGAPDVIEHGKNGWLIPPLNPNALKDGLNILLRNNEVRQKLGNQARERICKDYSLGITVDRTYVLYRQIFERRN